MKRLIILLAVIASTLPSTSNAQCTGLGFTAGASPTIPSCMRTGDTTSVWLSWCSDAGYTYDIVKPDGSSEVTQLQTGFYTLGSIGAQTATKYNGNWKVKKYFNGNPLPVDSGVCTIAYAAPAVYVTPMPSTPTPEIYIWQCATITVSPQSPCYTYQWHKKQSNGSWAMISGATGLTYKTKLLELGTFACEIIDQTGGHSVFTTYTVTIKRKKLFSWFRQSDQTQDDVPMFEEKQIAEPEIAKIPYSPRVYDKVIIYDITGKEIVHFTNISSDVKNHEIIQKLSARPGIYFICKISNNQVFAKDKVIKQQ